MPVWIRGSHRFDQRYSYNGTGVRPFEILAEISFILSQLVQSALLLLIGYGYTLIPVDVDPATVLLTFGISAVVHIILVLLIKAEDSADKFHDYEGLAGKTLLALRLASFAVFLWCLKSTMTGAPYRIRGLLSMFAFVGAQLRGFGVQFALFTPASNEALCISLGHRFW
eukprot:g15268.t1